MRETGGRRLFIRVGKSTYMTVFAGQFDCIVCVCRVRVPAEIAIIEETDILIWKMKRSLNILTVVAIDAIL